MCIEIMELYEDVEKQIVISRCNLHTFKNQCTLLYSGYYEVHYYECYDRILSDRFFPAE